MTLPALQDPVAHRLGWALIHFVWQGAVLALVLKLLLIALRRRSSNVRYLAACGAMLCLVAAPVLTFLAVPEASPLTKPSAGIVSPQAAGLTANAPQGEGLPSVIVRIITVDRAPAAPLFRWLEANLSSLLLGWIAGVLLLSARLGASWWHVQRLAATGSPLAGAEWTGLVLRVSARMGVVRPVRLLESALVKTPAVMCWLRPIVLLPASTLTGLRPDELEWILAHELAHIRRRDYLVNLLQSAAETLLFYHPAVWWVSAQIRVEREDCCDDLVIAAGGDRAGYAKALATLEVLRGSEGLALAVNGAPLLHRVRRLLGYTATDQSSGVWILGTAVSLACLLWLTGERGTLATQIGIESSQPAEVPPSEAPEVQEAAPESVIDPTTGASVESDPQAPKLFTRTYRVEPVSFLESIRQTMHGSDGKPPEMADTGSALRSFLEKAGVKFPNNNFGPPPGSAPPRGKAAFFSDRTGMLLVRATLEELDAIERALTLIQAKPPQVQIEIKFVELGEGEFQGLGLESLLAPAEPDSTLLVTNRTGILPSASDTNNFDLFASYAHSGIQKVTRGARGTLTEAQFKTVLRAIEQRPGGEVLFAPSVTTLSGRQARIEVAEIRNILTAFDPGTTAIPVGPSIDVVPYVSADLKSIQMTLIPGMATFVGYDDPGPFLPAPGSPALTVVKPLPRFSVTQTVTRVVLPDGHTLVMTGFGRLWNADRAGKAVASPEPKQVVIFVTPTVVDATGKRVNPD